MAAIFLLDWKQVFEIFFQCFSKGIVQVHWWMLMLHNVYPGLSLMEILIRKHTDFHIKAEVFVATAGPDQKLKKYVCQEKQQDIASSRFGENGSTRTAFSLAHLSPLITVFTSEQVHPGAVPQLLLNAVIQESRHPICTIFINFSGKWVQNTWKEVIGVLQCCFPVVNELIYLAIISNAVVWK